MGREEVWKRGYSTYVKKGRNRVYEYKKDNKNNEWVSNDWESNFIIFSVMKVKYQIEKMRN